MARSGKEVTDKQAVIHSPCRTKGGTENKEDARYQIVTAHL